MSEVKASGELRSMDDNSIKPNTQVGGSGDSSPSPRLGWDIGTAYDLFISLDVLLHPEDFGLRASGAAGVRSRLTTSERETLESCDFLCGTPLH